jgi:lipopolysaccharide/colanic/teichoic acid biosynthesis glycosyltransferase
MSLTSQKRFLKATYTTDLAYQGLPNATNHIRVAKLSYLYCVWYHILNLFFIFAGVLLLLLLLPPLAVLIYITAPGPIFYTQERLGYNGSTFRMYKFRTMHVEKEPQRSSSWTTQHDPRITSIGHLLRASHLDELPQIANILFGQMSLIGPRPELPDVAERLKKFLPQHHKRLLAKPGLTGLAQVMHHYGDSIQDEEIKLMYDFYYIEHQSFRLDMQILLRTIGEVVLRHGR